MEKITSKYKDTSTKAQEGNRSELQTAVGYSKNIMLLDALALFGKSEEKLDLEVHIHAFSKKLAKVHMGAYPYLWRIAKRW